MKPNQNAAPAVNTRPTPSADLDRNRLPSQITPKKLFLALAVVYGLWLAWMAYVAWVNVQAGNQ